MSDILLAYDRLRSDGEWTGDPIENCIDFVFK